MVEPWPLPPQTSTPPPPTTSARRPSNGSAAPGLPRAHLLVYTLVIALLWTIWALTGTGFPWPLIVMGGWGVGLIMNAYDVYAREPLSEADIEREIEKLQKR